MPKIILKIEHPRRDGYLVKLEDGTSWSCIDLDSPFKHLPSVRVDFHTFPDDRFEAMGVVGDIQRVENWSVDDRGCYRDSTMEGLLKQLEESEPYDKST